MGVLGELNHTPLKSGKSKSKTPLKSPRPAPVGVLSPNNDALEKRRSKLARQASETSRRWVYCTPPLTSPHGARKLFQHHKKFSVVTPDSGDARLLLHVTAARAGGLPDPPPHAMCLYSLSRRSEGTDARVFHLRHLLSTFFFFFRFLSLSLYPYRLESLFLPPHSLCTRVSHVTLFPPHLPPLTRAHMTH